MDELDVFNSFFSNNYIEDNYDFELPNVQSPPPQRQDQIYVINEDSQEQASINLRKDYSGSQIYQTEDEGSAMQANSQEQTGGQQPKDFMILINEHQQPITYSGYKNEKNDESIQQFNSTIKIETQKEKKKSEGQIQNHECESMLQLTRKQTDEIANVREIPSQQDSECPIELNEVQNKKFNIEISKDNEIIIQQDKDSNNENINSISNKDNIQKSIQNVSLNNNVHQSGDQLKMQKLQIAPFSINIKKLTTACKVKNFDNNSSASSKMSMNSKFPIASSLSSLPIISPLTAQPVASTFTNKNQDEFNAIKSKPKNIIDIAINDSQKELQQLESKILKSQNIQINQVNGLQQFKEFEQPLKASTKKIESHELLNEQENVLHQKQNSQVIKSNSNNKDNSAIQNQNKQEILSFHPKILPTPTPKKLSFSSTYNSIVSIKETPISIQKSQNTLMQNTPSNVKISTIKQQELMLNSSLSSNKIEKSELKFQLNNPSSISMKTPLKSGPSYENQSKEPQLISQKWQNQREKSDFKNLPLSNKFEIFLPDFKSCFASTQRRQKRKSPEKKSEEEVQEEQFSSSKYSGITSSLLSHKQNPSNKKKDDLVLTQKEFQVQIPIKKIDSKIVNSNISTSHKDATRIQTPITAQREKNELHVEEQCDILQTVKQINNKLILQNSEFERLNIFLDNLSLKSCEQKWEAQYLLEQQAQMKREVQDAVFRVRRLQ